MKIEQKLDVWFFIRNVVGHVPRVVTKDVVGRSTTLAINYTIFIQHVIRKGALKKIGVLIGLYSLRIGVGGKRVVVSFRHRGCVLLLIGRFLIQSL